MLQADCLEPFPKTMYRRKWMVSFHFLIFSSNLEPKPLSINRFMPDDASFFGFVTNPFPSLTAPVSHKSLISQLLSSINSPESCRYLIHSFSEKNTSLEIK